MLSLCIFVKQPVANGQEVFLKVLQIYIMFLRTGACIRITDLPERRKAGAFVQPDSSLGYESEKGQKSQDLPAQNSIFFFKVENTPFMMFPFSS